MRSRLDWIPENFCDGCRPATLAASGPMNWTLFQRNISFLLEFKRPFPYAFVSPQDGWFYERKESSTPVSGAFP